MGVVLFNLKLKVVRMSCPSAYSVHKKPDVQLGVQERAMLLQLVNECNEVQYHTLGAHSTTHWVHIVDYLVLYYEIN